MRNINNFTQWKKMDQSTWRSRARSHTKITSRSLGGVQWTFSIHSAYLLKSQSENKKIKLECMNCNYNALFVTTQVDFHLIGHSTSQNLHRDALIQTFLPNISQARRIITWCKIYTILVFWPVIIYYIHNIMTNSSPESPSKVGTS